MTAVGPGLEGDAGSVPGTRAIRLALLLPARDFNHDEYWLVDERIAMHPMVERSIVSTSRRAAVSNRGLQVPIGKTLEECCGEEWDCAVLIGGEGIIAFREHPSVAPFLQRVQDAGGVIAGICGAPTAMAIAGLLRGRRATVWNKNGKNASLLEAHGATYVDQRVVLDGAVITANGVEAAEEFMDAISKCMEERGLPWAQQANERTLGDLGRNRENTGVLHSRSGSAVLGEVLETEHSLRPPKEMLIEFDRLVQEQADRSGADIDLAAVVGDFYREYVDVDGPLQLQTFTVTRLDSSSRIADCHLIFTRDGRTCDAAGRGNGPIDACMQALRSHIEGAITVATYDEHALVAGSDSSAICYIRLANERGATAFGAGVDTDITIASAKAIFAALNRLN